MAPVAIVYAVLMILLGVVTYIATDAKSMTALIPTFAGAVFLVLGLLALNEHMRKHAMHAASALGLIAFIAPVVNILARGGSTAAVTENTIMALLSAAFTGLCVRSFIMARRARERAASQPAA